MEQPLPEAILEPGDRLRYRGPRHPEIAGSGGEGAKFGDFGEDRPGFEIWQRHREFPFKRKECRSIFSVFCEIVEAHLPVMAGPGAARRKEVFR